MSKLTSDKFLKLIPSLFEINLNSDKSGQTIFTKLEQVIGFDEGFIRAPFWQV